MSAEAKNVLTGKIPTLPVVDKTLTRAGYSADAKVTGEAIAENDKKIDVKHEELREELDIERKRIDESRGLIDQIANNQIPEEYLEAAVDKYVEENSAGFATQASLEATESDLKHNLVNDSDGVLVSGVLIDNDIALSTGKYVSNSYVGVDWKKYLVDNDGSYFTPSSIDVSSCIGGKLKISVTEPNNGSRFFGFCDSNDLVSELYYEAMVMPQFKYNPHNGVYELFLDITNTNFFFSYTKSVLILKIEMFPPQNVYKKDEIDNRFKSVNGTIEKLECAIGIKEGVEAAISNLRITAENTRIVSEYIDIELATSISVHGIPGYDVALFYKEHKSGSQEKGYGWFSEIERYNIEGAEDAYIGFRKQGNLEMTNDDLEIIKSSLGVFLYYEYSSDSSDCGIAYVSTTGDDYNEGSMSSPYATMNKALSSGASTIMVFGGVYEQNIDLSQTKNGRVEIRNCSTNERVIFTPASRIVSDTENAVEGYTKIFSVGDVVNFPNTLKWIYQDMVNDETTLILDEERHPLQRGYEYRCEDTKIERCAATALSDALLEIESSATYKWYFDADNSALYFSRPVAVTSANPICRDVGSMLFLNGDRSKSVKLLGIETKYMSFNIDGLGGAEVYDCKSANAFSSGGFIWDKGLSCKFVRCEATRCQSGSNGDGFNGHSSNTGDIHSKQTTVSLIDCWSHDNNDDGYSDHERSEITIIGGLYEYNQKGGVTPSYGSHCTCYNVYSRKNHNGFYYTGRAEEAEGGKYGQMSCFNCVAESNNEVTGSSGFRTDGTKNSMYLVNCKAINNRCGYSVGNDNIAKLIDCGSVDNITALSGLRDNFSIVVTSIVTG